MFQTYLFSSLFCTVFLFVLIYLINGVCLTKTTIKLSATILVLLIVFEGNYSLYRPIQPAFNFLIWLFFVYQFLLFKELKHNSIASYTFHGSAFLCIFLSTPFYSAYALAYYFFVCFSALRECKFDKIRGYSLDLALLSINVCSLVLILFWRHILAVSQAGMDFSARLGLITTRIPSAKFALICVFVGYVLVHSPRIRTVRNGIPRKLSILLVFFIASIQQ